MDKFLEKYNLPRLNQEVTENMNRLIVSTEMETVIQKLPTDKSPGPYNFTDEFYQIFIERLNLYFWNSPKHAEERTLPRSFFKGNITLTPKQDKDNTKMITGQYHWWT